MKRIVGFTFVFFTLIVILFKVSKSETFQFFGELVNRAETTEKIVALTFDDGPSKGKTEQVLSILDENDVKATFYLVGESISRNIELARLIVEQGHEVGNHSFSHQVMVLKSHDFIEQEIDKTNGLIRNAGYSGDITFRPPYGKKLFVLPYYAEKNEIASITWDVAPDSVLPMEASPEDLTNYTLKNTRPGSIILMHVMFKSRANSMAAVPEIIKGLKSQGYRFVTVIELLKSSGA